MEKKALVPKPLVFTLISVFLLFGLWFIPAFSNAPLELTLADRLLLSLVSIITVNLARIGWTETSNSSMQQKEIKDWTILHDADKEVHNSRIYFREVVAMKYGERDVFVIQCKERIQRISGDIKNVAEKLEIRVDKNHLLTVEDVLDIFRDDGEQIWRYTWPISGSRKLFINDAWREYITTTSRMLRKKQLKGIHPLLIISDYATLDDPRIKKLLDFYKTNKGMKCKYILEDRFRDICVKNGIPNQSWIDFGIYTKKLLFVSDSDPSGNGLFTKEPHAIETYSKIFTTVWKGGLSFDNPSLCNSAVSAQDLIDFDDNNYKDNDRDNGKDNQE